jgi:hypothetical protein
MRFYRHFSGVAALILMAATPALKAGTIVSVTGFADHTYVVGSLEAILASSFTITTAYDNVSVSANFDSSVGTGTAYLTNRIGPGTTAGNVLATGTYTTTGDDLLFSGLDLTPGSYYVVAFGTFNQGWDGTDNPTVVTASGVTRNADYFTNQFGSGVPNTSFPPASTLLVSNPQLNLLYSVTGDVAPTVPEPGTWMLLLSAGAACIAIGRMRRAVPRRAI